MKRLLLASVAGVALMAGAPANAADLGTRLTWMGCYIGGHAGGAWSHLNMTDVGNAAGAAFAAAGTAGQVFSLSDSALFAGGQTGCNYQYGLFVFGIEGDLGWMDLNGSALDPHTASNTKVGIRSGLYGDVTGRVGIAAGRALFYAKGGWAFYNGKEAFSTNSVAFISNSDVGTFNGYAAGVGIEYRLWSNWSAKVEYLHFGFGTETFNAVATGGTFPFKEKLNVDTVKAGVNYRFGWREAPVVAKD